MYKGAEIIQPTLINPEYSAVDSKLKEAGGKGRFQIQVSDDIAAHVIRLMEETNEALNGRHGLAIHAVVNDEVKKRYFYPIKNSYFSKGTNLVDGYEKVKDLVIENVQQEEIQADRKEGCILVQPDGTIESGYMFTANVWDLIEAFGYNFGDVEEEIFGNREEGACRTVCFLAAMSLLRGSLGGLKRKHNGMYIFDNKEGVISLIRYVSQNPEVNPNVRIDTEKRKERGNQGSLGLVSSNSILL